MAISRVPITTQEVLEQDGRLSSSKAPLNTVITATALKTMTTVNQLSPCGVHTNLIELLFNYLASPLDVV